MTNITALDRDQHRNLRVITTRGAEYGEDTHFVPVVAHELISLALEYPVILLKDSKTGGLGMCAMLGFEPGENLFLNGSDWDAVYTPVNILRQPFSIAYAREIEGKPDPESLVISLDMDSKRVQTEEGEALFSEDGSRSPFLDGVNDLLANLGPAAAATKAFIAALDQHDLIGPAQINMQLASGEQKSFDGLFTVDEEKLGKLQGDALTDMYKRGYLQGAWLMLASIGNVRKLIQRKAARDVAAGEG